MAGGERHDNKKTIKIQSLLMRNPIFSKNRISWTGFKHNPLVSANPRLSTIREQSP